MKDKFILMNLDDARSKKIADVLGNKTCKKIVGFLSDTKEASEKDIADELGIPINTVEYNLKKLLNAGLLEKTKNFFWSKKGRKIDMYKLSNKSIVISPKKKPTMSSLKTIIPVILSIVIVAILLGLIIPSYNEEGVDLYGDQSTLKTFNSQEEIKNFLEENQGSNSYFYGRAMSFGVEEAVDDGALATTASMSSNEKASGASDYSETNIQVEGVDEPDIVKNDGKYIYYVTGEQVLIIDSYPAQELEILSEINLSGISNIFINEDKLVVFAQEYKSGSKTKVNIYGVRNRSNPELENEIEIDGYYTTSRMIDDKVYVIANQHTYLDNGGVVLPRISVDGVSKEIAATEISYFPYPDTSYTFTNILAIDVDDGDFESETYLTGASHNVFVSEDNIYLTYTKRIQTSSYFEELVEEVFLPILPSEERNEINEIMDSDEEFYIKQREVGEVVEDYSMSLKGDEKQEFDKKLMREMEKFSMELQKRLEVTIVHKININEMDIEYVTNGEVPGRVLNQFSMDEYEGNFRVTTTTGNTWGETSLNHLYVLDENLEIIGSVEDLAKGERIYSTRFIGDKAYVVTFRQVDPLFVIDLSDAENPEVLGQLKVTGYSSYLHPYDENHVIGIGKEATEEGRVQGVKIALFDVSDVENPIQKAKYEVGEGESEKYSWSNSNALYDHKAFLFNKERELLVLPMSYTNRLGDDYNDWKHWQGAFVFKINTEEISLRAEIEHKENESEEGYYYGPYAVQRSLYMDDVLYTLSRTMIKANDLNSLDEINKLKLPYEEERYYYGHGLVEASVESPIID